MAPSSGELWGHHLMPKKILVDCLLPNGVLVTLKCYRETPLEALKAELWKEAVNYPLANLLEKDPGLYIFVSVTLDAEREEFYDEARRLCDLRLFQPVLKLVEPKGNKEEKLLNYDIGIALGFNLHEFNERDVEVNDFRKGSLEIGQEAVRRRNENGKESQALYAYPPEVENSPELPISMKEKLEKDSLQLKIVWSLTQQREKQKYTVLVNAMSPPSEIIRESILKKVRNSEKYNNQDPAQVVEEHMASYVLKVAGADQFLLKQCPISQYKYIRACIVKDEIPQLMMLYKDGVYDNLVTSDILLPSYMRKSLPPLPKETRKLWHIDRPFRVHVNSATYVNLKETDFIYVRLGIFHGTEAICQIRQTKTVPHSMPRWDEPVEFEDMFTLDLPRAAKLCLSICSVKKRKNREETTMLCWGNISLFDWRSHLLANKESINLWPVPRGMDDLLNPLGVLGSNPSKDSPCLELKFDAYEHPVSYPTLKDFHNYADFMRGTGAAKELQDIPQESASLAEHMQLLDIANRDPLTEITEQEKVALWKLRQCCLQVPDILPRFLDAVKWNSRNDMTHLYLLLEQWPQVSTQTALELLDCKYADPTVRSMAVQWLHDMSDEDLAQYLLQLVQTLKYEPYLNNPLSNFLLKRALLNRKIGHFFFWHLRSELHSPALMTKFGLLLEAFCRGLGPYLKDLIKQVEAMDKLTKLTDSLKDRFSQESVKELMKFMSEQIQQSDYVESLQYFHSPLENTVLLGELEFSRCKVMDSAKKPLWLEWKNPDELADKLHEYNALIFKNGDDLRQDMLTLQVITVMDHIWHTEGLDLRMTPYTCLSTGNHVGIIQVVPNAKTVYQIQRQASKLAAIQMDTTQLYKWIRSKQKTEQKLKRAINTFTYSCAGYCVATFILGIKDRHPDNIMVNEDGQIFHIDFGHFLGHFKKKFGINRERVPFVLTEDFLKVISNGADNPTKSVEFEHFQKLCGRAYLALRKHANLLITLFTMMLPTGITELQSINDVGYLRKTLAVEKTDQEALKYFQDMCCDAYGGAWTTKVDWFFHGLKRGV